MNGSNPCEEVKICVVDKNNWEAYKKHASEVEQALDRFRKDVQTGIVWNKLVKLKGISEAGPLYRYRHGRIRLIIAIIVQKQLIYIVEALYRREGIYRRRMLDQIIKKVKALTATFREE